jgi:hypothetical protein
MSLSNLFPDPFNTVSPWSQEMMNVSHGLFLFLFFLELCVLGVQSMYFKDSVFEYIKMFAGKVFIGSVVVALLANSNLIFPTIVGMFVNVSQTISSGGTPPPPVSSCLNNEAFTCVAAPSNSDIVVTMLGWAVTYFIAANVSIIADGVLSIASGILFGIPFPPDPGNGDAGLPMAFMLGHGQFQLVCFGLGMLCILAALGVTLTYYLLMFETQVILVLGVFTLAGHGLRFTKQYADAFPKYCFTIGAKFFAYYFVVAICTQLTASVNYGQMLAALIGNAMIPFGLGAIILLMATTTAPIVTIICAVAISAIPQFAGSLTQGGSALGGASALGQVMGQMKPRK